MGPSQFKKAMQARGFTLESSGRWHGPFGILIAGTYNDLDTTGLADRARDSILRDVDAKITIKRKWTNAT